MKLLKIVALSVSSLAIFGSTALAVTPSSGQCVGLPTVNVPASSIRILNVNNKNIVVGIRSEVKVNGNGNCVSGAGKDILSITGNGNYITAKTSVVKIAGDNNYFDSQGRNSLNCGGSQANVNPKTDAFRNCIL